MNRRWCKYQKFTVENFAGGCGLKVNGDYVFGGDFAGKNAVYEKLTPLDEGNLPREKVWVYNWLFNSICHYNVIVSWQNMQFLYKYPFNFWQRVTSHFWGRIPTLKHPLNRAPYTKQPEVILRLISNLSIGRCRMVYESLLFAQRIGTAAKRMVVPPPACKFAAPSEEHTHGIK